MPQTRSIIWITLASMTVLGACSSGSRILGGLTDVKPAARSENIATENRKSTIWDVFDTNQSEIPVKVNRYIWQASLDVLDFLPIETVDPFSGVIVTGYGTPPGGSAAYKATVYVSDPALDARTLRVALMTKRGPASAETVRAVEDAILTRARDLRTQDGLF